MDFKNNPAFVPASTNSLSQADILFANKFYQKKKS